MSKSNLTKHLGPPKKPIDGNADGLSWLPGNQSRKTGKSHNYLLSPNDIRLITTGRAEDLVSLVTSPYLHAVDSNGNTPLHLVARVGNLTLCDLFIRSGANPRVHNLELQTPADVAFAEGHYTVAQWLSSLKTISESPADVVAVPKQTERGDDLVDFLDFKVVEDPENFFNKSNRKTVSGKFAAPAESPISSTYEGTDWEIDLSPAWITGDGVDSKVMVSSNQENEYDFLKVRNRGTKSKKRAVMRSGTKLSIDLKICKTWATHFLEKGRFSRREIETLINLCDGNSDMEELRTNLQQTLEAAGLELIDETIEENFPPWDARSDVLLDDLVEAIEAAFTRATQLPGIQSFNIDKSSEAGLLEPMVRAKQELQLNTLACKPAVEIILDVIELIRQKSVISKFMETTPYDWTSNEETADFFKAADTLKFWQTNGRVMNGKRRREALEALGRLDLSIAFFKEMIKALGEHATNLEDVTRMNKTVSIFEIAMEQIILEHLPYVRRFASRNVENGEDPEDVFQVAFMGLQRSIRSFDPNFDSRFVFYCTYRMRAFLTRWRANESATIRIPVHRHESLAKLDRALENLDLGFDRVVSDDEIADELEWRSEKVKLLRQIPRQNKHFNSIEEWEKVLESGPDDSFDQAETKRIVNNILGELSERQADIIRRRYGIGYDDEMSLQEIGQIYGVTRERIRQIEAKGLARLLNHPTRRRHLQALLGI